MKRWYIGVGILMAFTVAPCSDGISRLSAAEQPECPAGDEWNACRAKQGDPIAMYVLGRTAYEGARTSGDFSEALAWSRQLAATGDKNGERLLKMVYLQLGWGAHHDYVQAYVWLSEGIAAHGDYLVPWRKMLVEKMTPEQVAKGKELAGN